MGESIDGNHMGLVLDADGIVSSPGEMIPVLCRKVPRILMSVAIVV